MKRQIDNSSTELQHVISDLNLNAQLGEIFRAAYRYGQASHSSKLRDIKKIIFYANAEIKRLEKLEAASAGPFHKEVVYD